MNRWTLEEDDTLATMWPASDMADILAAIPRHTYDRCVWRASFLGVRRKLKWTDAEDASIRSKYPLSGAKGVARDLSWRSVDAIAKRAQRIGVAYGR